MVASVADYLIQGWVTRTPLTTIDHPYWHFTHPLRVGQHELIYKVVIACFMANLPQPRYMVTCDVDKMLDLTFTLLWITLPYQTNV